MNESPEISKLKEECFEELIELRTQIANHNNLSNPETIISINVLRGLSEDMPDTVLEMLSCIGITESWFQMWGEEFLEVSYFNPSSVKPGPVRDWSAVK